MFIRSKTHYTDQLTISSGAKKLTLLVDLDLSSAARSFVCARKAIHQARISAQENPSPENMTTLAGTIRDLFICIFGEEQSERLMEFYGDSPASMLNDLSPYILRRIAPLLVRYSARRRRQLLRAARHESREHRP